MTVLSGLASPYLPLAWDSLEEVESIVVEIYEWMHHCDYYSIEAHCNDNGSYGILLDDEYNLSMSDIHSYILSNASIS